MTDEVKRGPGRPKGDGSKYTPETAQAILDDLEAGVSISQAARNAGVSPPSVLRWRDEDLDGFAERFVRARARGAELLGDDLIDNARVGSGDANRDRLVVDTMKWVYARQFHRSWGDKLVTEHAGTVKHEVGGLNLEDVAKMLAAKQPSKKDQ